MNYTKLSRMTREEAKAYLIEQGISEEEAEITSAVAFEVKGEGK
jgi:hypothetical protein